MRIIGEQRHLVAHIVITAFAIDLAGILDDQRRRREETGDLGIGVVGKRIGLQFEIRVDDLHAVLEKYFVVAHVVIPPFAEQLGGVVGQQGARFVGGDPGIEVVVEAVGEQFLVAVHEDHVSKKIGDPGGAQIGQGIRKNGHRVAVLDEHIAHGGDVQFVEDKGGVAKHVDAVLVELHRAQQLFDIWPFSW